MLTDTTLNAALTRDLEGPLSSRAAALAEFLAVSFGPGTIGVLHYGSHVHGSGAPHDSAYDFVVVVEETSPAFKAFTRRTQPRFSAATASVLAKLLPPNIVGVKPRDARFGGPVTAKCSVLSGRQLARACSRDAQDHFIKGRLFQPVRLAWVRDKAGREAIEAALIDARVGTFDWVRPSLAARFDTADYCRTLLAVSYSGEIRPETSDRADQLFQAQRHALAELYEPLLRDLADREVLRQNERGYSQSTPASAAERRRVALYFKRSKARATARWLKHIWLYEGWLDYVHQKVQRRGGVAIELTPREKQWPLVFLWPKAIRFLRSRR